MADIVVLDIAVRDIRGLGPGDVGIGPLIAAARPE